MELLLIHVEVMVMFLAFVGILWLSIRFYQEHRKEVARRQTESQWYRLRARYRRTGNASADQIIDEIHRMLEEWQYSVQFSH